MYYRFNPRPPKRTLCRTDHIQRTHSRVVSIHVLRRGRCVLGILFQTSAHIVFQSTSSEEDVVSVCQCRPSQVLLFQSTSSEEYVVSTASCSMLNDKLVSIHVLRRGRCVNFNWLGCMSTTLVSIHVLRRGRCVQV